MPSPPLSLNEYISAIDQELESVTHAPHSLYSDLFAMLQYHLGWTDTHGLPQSADKGKRLRPLICLWACEAIGGDWHDALPAAAAVELLHNFSLIHDDIEDNSDKRRGRPAVWKVWGLAQGVNAGDAMFVLAHLALDRLILPRDSSKDSSSFAPSNGKSFPLDRYREIHCAFDSASLALTQGQFLDLAFERADQVTPDQYLEMVRGKTAALIRAACEIGARIGTADAHVINQLAEYGENLGIAFQITDDILGIWGDPAVTGKSARADLMSRKKSYPVLAALQSDLRRELKSLYEQPDWSDGQIRRVEQILDETRAREQTVDQAEWYAQRALVALQATGLHNAAVERLHELAHHAIHRQK